jgi:hypothetical protein
MPATLAAAGRRDGGGPGPPQWLSQERMTHVLPRVGTRCPVDKNSRAGLNLTDRGALEAAGVEPVDSQPCKSLQARGFWC